MLFRLLPVGLLLVGMIPASARGAVPLIQFLDQTYGKGGTGFTRALDKFGSFLNSGKPLPPTAASVEGRKPDGSYLWSAMFNSATARTFAYPRRRLEKFCADSEGTFTQTLALDPTSALGSIAGTMSSAATTNALDPRYVALWRAQGVPERQIAANWQMGYVQALLGEEQYRSYGWVAGAIEQAQRDGAVGVFACQASGRTIWAVSIAPSTTYRFQTAAEHERNLLENSWWALSIRPVEPIPASPSTVTLDTR